MKSDGAADAVEGGLPGAQVVVDTLQRPEFFLEQRPDAARSLIALETGFSGSSNLAGML
ncbi:MAG TPA: hypothetical protein VMK84_04655 [Streptosporangiaceae bacterium]|nr:hypothetical protein [Streptosporangiaceae bacterium]